MMMGQGQRAPEPLGEGYTRGAVTDTATATPARSRVASCYVCVSQVSQARVR